MMTRNAYSGFVGLVLLAAACCLAGGCVQKEFEFAPSWTIAHGGITRGDPADKAIALIFTGGEHGGGSKHILDTLDHMGIKASFFVTGDYIREPGYPAHLRRMVDKGHYLGPHSDSHPLYCSWEDRSQTALAVWDDETQSPY